VHYFFNKLFMLPCWLHWKICCVHKGMYSAQISTKSYFEQITPSRKAELLYSKDVCFWLLYVSCHKYRLYVLVHTLLQIFIFFRKLLIVFSTDAPPPQKKKRPQISVVSTISRKDHALYRDTVAQQLQHRKNSVILVWRIFRKFQKNYWLHRHSCIS